MFFFSVVQIRTNRIDEMNADANAFNLESPSCSTTDVSQVTDIVAVAVENRNRLIKKVA